MLLNYAFALRPLVQCIALALSFVAAGFPTLIANAAQGAPVVVTPLGGQAVEGELVALDAERIILISPSGEQSFSARELPRLERRVPRRITESEDPSVGRVWLVAGSSLPISGVEVVGESGRVRLLLPPSAGVVPSELSLPLDALASIRLPGGPGGFDEAWSVIRGRQPTSDLIVTPPRGEGSLDYLEGFVESIDEEFVALLLDGQPVEAPLARVYGVVFAAGEAPRQEFQGPRVTSLSGVALNAMSLDLSANGVLLVKTAEGLEVTLPASGLASVDYRCGRVTAIGELTPTRTEFEPQFGSPAGGGGDLVRAAYRVDQSYWGRTLRVYDPQNEISKSREFSTGLAVRAGAGLVYELERRFDRFQAMVGVDPDAVGRRELRLELIADGRVVFDERLRSQGEPATVDVPVDGVRELRLRVHRLRGLDASLHLGDARFIR